MFWKLSSLQNVEERRVVPYCKGGLVTQARTRTHKYTHTQTEMRTRQCGDPCNERGGRVPLLITPLSLSSPVCAAQRNTLKSA